MVDPYSVLGISRDVSDEEIKKAYRQLSRKYHPDANINNPDKEKAEAKFKEVQQAYDQIMKEREYGNSYGNPFGGFSSAGAQGGNESEADTHIRAAANYINSGHYKEALNVLNHMSARSSIWFFYSAVANAGLGNTVNALEHARKAVQMEPGNIQYRMFLQNLESGSNRYRARQSMYGFPMMGGSTYCVNLCIANLICYTCGGGVCCGTPGGGTYL
ncbi:MAG: J domain-containing protein [Hespellia sp.]|jgi:molecular chaperone DnaJ|nr:J domain-containing protein [Hespellia sp.]